MLKNFIQETVNAPGTTTVVNLGGAATDRLPFTGAASFPSGSVVFYYMDDGVQAEAGYGTVTAGSPNTFSRDVVLWTSALGNASPVRLNFTNSGTKIYNEIPAERAVWRDQNGNVSLPGALTVAGAAAVVSLTASGLISGMGAVPIGSGMDFWGDTPDPGYVWAAGQALSRTTYVALFAKCGVKYGTGDGTTTFNVPDKRDRASIGKGDMGGTAAGRITTAIGGINSATLGAAGGDERLHAHLHSITDPGHVHGITDTGHVHGVNDGEHSHGVNDAGHAHGMFDQLGGPGANISGRDVAVGITSNLGGPKGTDSANTGISIQASFSNISIANGGTGISIQNHTTGVSIQTAGAGASQNVQPSIVCNYIIFAGV